MRARLARLVMRLGGFQPDAQKQLNVAVADELARLHSAQEQLRHGLVTLQDRVARELAALARFESELVQCLMTVTAYVDTKDRALGGAELQDRLGLVEERVIAIRRELERATSGDLQAGQAREPLTPGGRLDAGAYVAFENRFRGARTEIRGRVEDYVPVLASADNVVDVGCGRGELLDLLRANGVRARGVDVNDAMVALCQSRDLDVERGDALSYLARQADGSIGGLVAIQVVEHFTPEYLVRFLDSAHGKMRKGAPLILETINPACWMAFFESYMRDLTHERPLHPDTLRYLVEASGFTAVDVRFRQPVREEDRLDRVPGAGTATPDFLAAVATALNAHADKLNARLFSSMDYVLIARR
jgi:O-antigen chain-terminating methyltransferase